jgi:perosamine synthetase
MQPKRMAESILTTGEGGMVVTDNKALAELARLYRGQGAPRAGHYEHEVIGYNYRMTDIAAAIGLAQLETYDEHARRRRLVVDIYRKTLEGDVEMQATSLDGAVPADWSVGIILPPGKDRGQVMADLEQRGIETRPFFVPLPGLEAYHDCVQTSVTNAVHVAGRGLNLPTHAGLEEADVLHICEQLLEVVA